jgi:hypothetical protein
MGVRIMALRRATAVLLLLGLAGCAFKNNPPDTPATPTGPTEAYSNQTMSYVSSTTDPDGDSVYLSFSSDLGGYEYSEWSPLVASGDTVSKKYSWYNSGTYKVRVRALDQHGSCSDWSQWLVITVRETTGLIEGGFGQGSDKRKESQ